MNKTIFYNSNPVAISSKMNEYMKSNFGYEIEGDLESLREAKVQLEAQKREMTSNYQDRAYVENMLMIETIKSLLKAHVAEGELPAGLKAYQDAKKKGKAPAKKKAKGDGKMPMDDNGTPDDKSDDKPAFLKNESVATEGKYKSDAQRKAVHASKAEKTNEGDAPKFDTMTKYSNTYEAPKEYKMKKEKLEEGLLAQLNKLLESDAAEAEVMMAARGIVDELQDMIEKLGKLQNDQLGPLTDEMAYSHGPERAASFKDAVNDAVAGLLGQARATKDTVNDAVLVLNGEAPADDMSAGDVIGGDMQDDFEDDVEVDFASGDEAASGPNDEPLGRAKRS
jgi:hypothetical protein